MRKFLKDETAEATIVEAAVVYPIAFLLIFFLYYTSIFLCQKANIEANLHTSLLYYKNTITDMYVTPNSQMNYSWDGAVETDMGNGYDNSKGVLFPYRLVFSKFDKNAFEQFFHQICGHMFFLDTSDIKLKFTNPVVHNYFIFKEVQVKATQTVTPAINLSLIGGPKEFKIEAEADVIIQDQDEWIRNIDLACYYVEKTEFGKKLIEAKGKISDAYNKIKKTFHI